MRRYLLRMPIRIHTDINFMILAARRTIAFIPLACLSRCAFLPAALRLPSPYPSHSSSSPSSPPRRHAHLLTLARTLNLTFALTLTLTLTLALTLTLTLTLARIPVDGVALGGGFEMALLSDWIVCSETSRFGDGARASSRGDGCSC